MGAWVLGGRGRRGRLLLGVLGGMLACGVHRGVEEDSEAEQEEEVLRGREVHTNRI